MPYALRHQLVPEAVDRQDVLRLVGELFDLLAELDDEVVDGAVGGVGFDAPDLVQDLLSAHGLAHALVQEPEELDLVERELLGGLAPGERVRGGAHGRGADLERPGVVRRAIGAAKDGAEARHELAGAEGLGDVVVRARVEATDLVGLLALRGQHDDRHERIVTPDLLAHLVPVQIGEHQIEEHRVGLLVASERRALLPVRSGDDPEPLEPERIGDTERHRWLVLDDENRLSGLHGRPMIALRPARMSIREPGAAGSVQRNAAQIGAPKHAMSAVVPAMGV